VLLFGISIADDDSIASNELVEEITAKGRWITRSISPFISLSCVLYAGMPSDDEL
jgi:hypothetical protein